MPLSQHFFSLITCLLHNIFSNAFSFSHHFDISKYHLNHRTKKQVTTLMSCFLKLTLLEPPPVAIVALQISRSVTYYAVHLCGINYLFDNVNLPAPPSIFQAEINPCKSFPTPFQNTSFCLGLGIPKILFALSSLLSNLNMRSHKNKSTTFHFPSKSKTFQSSMYCKKSSEFRTG